MKPWGIPAIAVGAALLAVVTGGLEPFGRLALRAGAPAIAESLVSDPALKGIALSRQGRHAEAVDPFTEAGPRETYNRATAYALDGDYAEALLSYDDLLARDPDHLDARANFMLLASVYGGTKLELTFMDIDPEKRDGPTVLGPEAQAGARAIGDGSETDGRATDIFAPDVATSSGVRRTPKIFDDVFIAASEEWLTTMLDQPGNFLRARLQAEQKRRRAEGIGVEAEEGAW